MRDLVLLPGWSFDCRLFDAWRHHLTDFRLHLLDLPGFGQRAQQHWPEDEDALLDTILEYAPAQATYAGWSLGGLLAVKLALYAPARVSEVISFCSTPRLLSDNDWPGVTDEAAQRMLQLTDQPARLLRLFDRWIGGSPNKTNPWRSDCKPNNLARSLNFLFSSDERKNLSQLTRPYHAVFSEHDALIPNEQVKLTQELSPRIKYAKGQTHLLCLEQPQHCCQLIKEACHVFT